MAEEIFRKKSLNRIKSPEDLNDYVRVANPGVWMLLVAVVVLLAGVCVWGFFGRIETKVPGRLVVGDGAVVCTVEDANVEKIEAGMTVVAGDEKGVIVSADGKNISADISLPDGTYEADVITESIRPLSFVFN